MKLGSLFDGLGTWQLAAVRAGIKPVWSSEIEKFPCEVTARHFPDTIQLGDINQLDGAKIEPVDIITAGSPCTDLSSIGKRSGIHGKQSGLFFRAIEVVRQMQQATDGKFPRYFLWENVTGAFSSNGGKDFQTILEAITQTGIPLPARWAEAGLVDGRDYQLAWRTFDSQYWGVPQRRRRIFLVADFRGQCAGQILFESKSVSGSSATSETAKRSTAARTGSHIADSIGFNTEGSCAAAQYELIPTLRTNNKMSVAYSLQGRFIGRNKIRTDQGRGINKELCFTLTSVDRHAVATKDIVRRLTPLECERLMGLPDNWTAGGSDNARYKTLGNGIALPIAEWIFSRLMSIF